MRIPHPETEADRPRDDRPDPPRQPTYTAHPEVEHPLSVDPTVAHDHADRPTTHDGHGGHGLMMMLMCIPMLLIAGLLVVTGAAGTGAVVAAVLCMAMMAAMMFMMPGGHSHK
jgi:hypothetical protein